MVLFFGGCLYLSPIFEYKALLRLLMKGKFQEANQAEAKEKNRLKSWGYNVTDQSFLQAFKNRIKDTLPPPSFFVRCFAV